MLQPCRTKILRCLAQKFRSRRNWRKRSMCSVLKSLPEWHIIGRVVLVELRIGSCITFKMRANRVNQGLSDCDITKKFNSSENTVRRFHFIQIYNKKLMIWQGMILAAAGKKNAFSRDFCDKQNYGFQNLLVGVPEKTYFSVH